MTEIQVTESTDDTIKELLEKSVEAKSKAYAKYSNFQVGAALLTKDGTIFTGCNVENCVYPLCTCAERCAVVKAVSEGHTEFKAIAVNTNNDYSSPCGNCRQILREFGDFKVILTKKDISYYKCHTVAELLPYSFTDQDLSSGQKK